MVRDLLYLHDPRVNVQDTSKLSVEDRPPAQLDERTQHPVLAAELKKLTTPISRDELLKAFTSVMPLTDENYRPVLNAMNAIRSRRDDMEGSAWNLMLHLNGSLSPEDLTSRWRTESLGSAAKTGHGVTKKELISFLRSAYSGRSTLSPADVQHLSYRVRDKQFARTTTAKVAQAILSLDMSAHQAGIALGRRI